MSKQPDYRVCLCKKDVGSKREPAAQIGAAWISKSKSSGENYISLKLNPGVVLSWRDMEDHTIKLFDVGIVNRMPKNDKDITF